MQSLSNGKVSRRHCLASVAALGLPAIAGLQAKALQVGAHRAVKTIAEAADQALDGDTVEVDAGTYAGDVATWHQNNLSIRAVGGRVRLLANGSAAEGKGIWVVRGGRISVEGFDFTGTRVADRNGAGIRFEQGFLAVRHCAFINNEMGILTNNDPQAELAVENCEFAFNRRPDGHNHNLYAGSIARLTVIGSYFHHGLFGHLLKSRAAVNHILYNRLTDEADGRASYELEFPNGGIAYVIGNIIAQSRGTENPVLVSFGAEGYTWPKRELYLVHNTLVDERLYGGVLLRVKPGAAVIRAVNNVMVGSGAIESAGPGEYRNNFSIDRDEFEPSPRRAYVLKSASRYLGRATDPGSANGQDLNLHSEYVHPMAVEKLRVPARDPGAMQTSGRPLLTLQ